VTADPRISTPTRSVGFISPLEVIDTALWEFYRIAPPNVIAAAISVGLRGLDLRSSTEAIDANLARCIAQLARRKVEYIHLGGLPLLIHQDATFSDQFARRCLDEFGIQAGTAVDSDVAAFRALGVDRIVAVNKWGAAENALLRDLFETRGIALRTVSEETAFTNLKGDFAVGMETARRLVATAMKEHPDAGCLYLAGGAWLTLPLVEELEEQFGVPIVSSQVAKAWYALHRIGSEPVVAAGRLLSTRPQDGSPEWRPHANLC